MNDGILNHKTITELLNRVKAERDALKVERDKILANDYLPAEAGAYRKFYSQLLRDKSVIIAWLSGELKKT